MERARCREVVGHLTPFPGTDTNRKNPGVGSSQRDDAGCVAKNAGVVIRRVAGEGTLRGVSDNRKESRGSLGENRPIGQGDKSPVNGQYARYFIEMIGLFTRSGVALGAPALLIRTRRCDS